MRNSSLRPKDQNPPLANMSTPAKQAKNTTKREMAPVKGEEPAAISLPKNTSSLLQDSSQLTPSALNRDQSSIHQELDAVLNYDLVSHDDSSLDNQNPTLQEQITALAQANKGYNADLLQLQHLKEDVLAIKISLADNMNLIMKALTLLNDIYIALLNIASVFTRAFTKM